MAGKAGKFLTIGFLVLNLLGVSAGAYLTFVSTIGYQPPKVSEEELNKELLEFEKSLRKDPVMYQLETFNTNLNGVPKRMIRIQLNLEMMDAEGFEEVMDLGAGTRDAIVKILNSTSFYEIESVQGKLQLKNQIITQLNSALRQGVVRNVYFSDFVVQ